MAYVNRNELQRKRREAERSDARRSLTDRNLENAYADLLKTSSDKSHIYDGISDKQREELERYTEQIRLTIGQYSEAVRRQTDEIRQELRATDEKNKENKQRLKEVSTQLSKEIERRDSLAKDRQVIAVYYLEQLQTIYNSIKNLYPEKYEALYPELLAPGTATVYGTLNFVIENIKNKEYDIAIGLAQSRIPDSSYILFQLEQLDSEFVRAKGEIECAQKETEVYFELVNDIEHLSLVIEGIQFTNFGNADFWSDGEFSRSKCEYEDTLSAMESSIESRDVEGLERIRSKFNDLNVMFQKYRSLIEENFRISCNVELTAKRVFDVLCSEKTGQWEIAENDGFLGNDRRCSYILNLFSNMGFSSKIVISPTYTNNSSNIDCAVAVISEDGNIEASRRVYEGIITALKIAGVNVNFSENTPILENIDSQSEYCNNEVNLHLDRRRIWLNQSLNRR